MIFYYSQPIMTQLGIESTLGANAELYFADLQKQVIGMLSQVHWT
jgi:hypothetical protein